MNPPQSEPEKIREVSARPRGCNYMCGGNVVVHARSHGTHAKTREKVGFSIPLVHVSFH